MSFCLLAVMAFAMFQAADAKCATFEADYVPWSGYWWPKVHGGLVTGADYRGHPAPFEKYDYVTSGTYYGPATRYGWKHHLDDDALLWEGLCFCWAAASVMEPEPVHGGIYKGTVFRVGDKKGLLTAAYFGTLYNQYPIDTPVDFHGVLENFIGDQKTPVIIDLGTHGESWNYPVFKYDTDFVQEGNIRHYTTTISYVGDDVPPDIVGAQVSTRTYYYYFELDENGNITASNWENESIDFPPIVAYEPFGTDIHNTGLDYDIVREIADTVDDPYEENNTFESAAYLPNGQYTVMGLDSDYFKVELRQGNTLDIRLLAESDVYLRTYGPAGDLLYETLAPEDQIVLKDELSEGTYFFEITPLEAYKEPVYELFLHHHLSHSAIFPIHPSGQWATGITLFHPFSNPNVQGDRAIITMMGSDGDPRISHYNEIMPRHLLGMLGEDFSLSPQTGTEYVRIESDVPLWGLQITSAKEELMSGANLFPLEKASASLFFPRLDRWNGWKTSFGIINTGSQREEIRRTAYGPDGEVLTSDITDIAPGQKLEDDTFSIPVLVSGSKSMGVSTISGSACLSGYIRFITPSDSKERGLVALDTETGPDLVVPHIASNADWWTDISVMNTGDEDSPLTFLAYDGEGNQIGLAEIQLKEKQNLVQRAAEIFPELRSEEIASMRMLSQNAQPLCGTLLYGTNDNLRLAAIPIQAADAPSLYLPLVASTEPWYTAIALMNAGDTPADIAFSLFGSDGELLGTTNKRMNPNQQIATLVSALFSEATDPSARYMEIESLDGEPISGVYLIGTDDGLRMVGDAIPPSFR